MTDESGINLISPHKSKQEYFTNYIHTTKCLIFLAYHFLNLCQWALLFCPDNPSTWQVLQIKMQIKQYYKCTGMLSTGHNQRTKGLTQHSITDVLWAHAVDMLTAAVLSVVAGKLNVYFRSVCSLRLTTQNRVECACVWHILIEEFLSVFAL